MQFTLFFTGNISDSNLGTVSYIDRRFVLLFYTNFMNFCSRLYIFDVGLNRYISIYLNNNSRT